MEVVWRTGILGLLRLHGLLLQVDALPMRAAQVSKPVPRQTETSSFDAVASQPSFRSS
jgi:hypothetical protein